MCILVSRSLLFRSSWILYVTNTFLPNRYKNGKPDGKVWGPWSGSSLHYLELMSTPRWEDYDIKYLSSNRYNFLGNGKTRRETEGGDLAYYVSEPGARSV